MKFYIKISIYTTLVFGAIANTHQPLHQQLVCKSAKSDGRTPASILPKEQVIDLTVDQDKAPYIGILKSEFTSSDLDFKKLYDLFSTKSVNNDSIEATSSYVDMSYKTFSVNSLDEWSAIKDEKIKPSCISTIYRYIDPQEEADLPDGKGIWEVVNRKLRDGVSLNEHEINFVKDLNCAIQNLPSVKALLFRGQSVSEKELTELKEKKVVTFPSFTSTTIAPDTGFRFARFNEPRGSGRIPALLIIMSDQGAAISAYLPENISEYEVLIAPNTRFEVVKQVLDSERKNAIIFLKTISK
jgi:hypothetical protein